MKYVYFNNSKLVSVTNIETGAVTQFFSDDPRFNSALDMIKMGDYEGVENMNTKVAIQNFVGLSDRTDVVVSIKDNMGMVRVNGYETELSDVLVNKIVNMLADGFDAQPMINFIGNLYSNPSLTAVSELFLFLEASQLPITEDGHFIAYKIVREDYKDIYTGTMDNSIGQSLSMPRNMVDDNRNNTCSMGLHFCSREYLKSYGSNDQTTDRCMLVKINPADVVSIPSDYNNAKGRTWYYQVVGEVADGWRQELSERDFTESSVLEDDYFDELDDHAGVEVPQTPDLVWKDEYDTIANSPFYYNVSGKRWSKLGVGPVGRRAVKDALGVTYHDLDVYEDNVK